MGLWRVAQHTATRAAVESAVRFTMEMGRRFWCETRAHPVLMSGLVALWATALAVVIMQFGGS